MRKTTELEQEAMEFLNSLRESGITNMFGAAPFVEDEFSIDKGEARRILQLWMRNFNEEGNYAEVEE